VGSKEKGRITVEYKDAGECNGGKGLWQGIRGSTKDQKLDDLFRQNSGASWESGVLNRKGPKLALPAPYQYEYGGEYGRLLTKKFHGYTRTRRDHFCPPGSGLPASKHDS